MKRITIPLLITNVLLVLIVLGHGAFAQQPAATVLLADGRTIIVPLKWYPRLLNANAEQRRDYRLLGDGEYIHWPQVDEDLTVAGLLRGTPAPQKSRG